MGKRFYPKPLTVQSSYTFDTVFMSMPQRNPLPARGTNAMLSLSNVIEQIKSGLGTQTTEQFSARIACSSPPALTAPQGKTDYHENNWERGRVRAAFNRAVSIFILINNAQQSAYLDLTDDIDLFGQRVSWERDWEGRNLKKERDTVWMNNEWVQG